MNETSNLVLVMAYIKHHMIVAYSSCARGLPLFRVNL